MSFGAWSLDKDEAVSIRSVLRERERKREGACSEKKAFFFFQLDAPLPSSAGWSSKKVVKAPL